MRVNYEFFGSEPIENVITCMKYRMDKVVFLGYQDEMAKWEAGTRSFLQEICWVREVEFLYVKRNEPDSILGAMRSSIQRDLQVSNEVYLDLTGGDSLIVFAYGILYKEYQLPVHFFDISADKLYEYNAKLPSMSAKVNKQDIRMTLDLFVRIYGGALNPKSGKEYKDLNTPEFWQDVHTIYTYAKADWAWWNQLSEFFRSNLKASETDKISVTASIQAVNKALAVNGDPKKKTKKIPYTMEQVRKMLQDLKNRGLIHHLVLDNHKIQFQYKSEVVKNIIWESGSTLELYVYQLERGRYSDAQVAIHIDWDGIIHENVQDDVHNEVDVLLLDCNLPVFVSCKCGKMEGKKVLNAMYELETVAKRFGGRYAQKRLVLTNEISNTYRQRAEEMGIEIQVL